jgi:hypothetical protein
VTLLIALYVEIDDHVICGGRRQPGHPKQLTDVAREPGHAGNAAVIHSGDGFPLAVDQVEKVQGLVREHGDRSMKPEDGTSGRDPAREVRKGRAVGRRHRTDHRACASHGLLLGCGDHAVTPVRQPRGPARSAT